jgi:DNA-binding MarR family transcriptional regulator
VQSLLSASNSASGDQDCAADLLDTVPVVMRSIRGHLRRHRSGLTIPQFRTLWFVSTADHHSLSDAADFIGLSLPAMSRLVDGLVEKKLIRRRACEQDRRHLRLSLSPAGEATLREASEMAKAHIAQSIAGLSAKERAAVRHAMKILRAVFTQ